MCRADGKDTDLQTKRLVDIDCFLRGPLAVTPFNSGAYTVPRTSLSELSKERYAN